MKTLRTLLHQSVFIAVLASAAIAGDPVFQASVDRATIGQDESVALKFRIVTDGMGGSEEPEFQAPDFDLVNQYSSVFVESYYENGKFGARNNRQFTKVLRPNRTGELTISGIQLKAGGRTFSHPPIRVVVSAGGRGTPPPQGYGGSGVGLRGAGKRPRGATIPFFIRAEVDHARVVKGQQIVVSYFLYQRVRAHNIQVDKYPVLDGFLREDLELPILGQRLTDRESVVLDGVAYERVLLARYAAYPLKEGRLSIDSMAIKGNYFAPPGGIADSQDPIEDALQNFMQQLQPRVWSHRSDPVPVEVQPLPLDGRPAAFAGGVGDFEITSTVDKTTVRVNEPVTLVLKIEGRGNTAAIGQPPVKWPADLEVYETKSRVAGSPGGVSAKIFEILLIPRRGGSFTLPEQELAYYSPQEGAYRTKKAPALDIVVEGQGDGFVPKSSSATSSTTSSITPGGDGLLLPEQWTGRRSMSSPLAQWIVQALVLLSGLLLAGVGAHKIWRRRHLLGSVRSALTRQRRGSASTPWTALRSQCARADRFSAGELVAFYQSIAQGLYSELESRLSLPARAWSRAEIRRQIEEASHDGSWMPDSVLWQRIENILEYSEALQFSGALQEQEARSRMETTLNEVERILALLQKEPEGGS